MKLVINIPDYVKKQADIGKGEELGIPLWLAYEIANATPIPEGHGRILDEKDILDTENNDGGWYDLVDMPEYIAGVKAIIEADKESEDKE